MIGAGRMAISRTVQSVFAPTLFARLAEAQVPARGIKELEPRVFVVESDVTCITAPASTFARVAKFAMVGVCALFSASWIVPP